MRPAPTATVARVKVISPTRTWSARGSDEHLDPSELRLPRKNSMLKPIGELIPLDHINPIIRTILTAVTFKLKELNYVSLIKLLQ